MCIRFHRRPAVGRSSVWTRLIYWVDGRRLCLVFRFCCAPVSEEQEVERVWRVDMFWTVCYQGTN